MPMEGEVDHDYAFSREWDTPVHLSCIRAAILKDPTDEEALIFARELLSFKDGIDHVANLKKHKEKKFKDAMDAAVIELSALSNEEFKARLDQHKESDMLPFIKEHVAANAAPYIKIEALADLLREVVDSDMAQRAEDEGSKSPLLEKIRKKIEEVDNER